MSIVAFLLASPMSRTRLNGRSCSVAHQTLCSMCRYPLSPLSRCVCWCPLACCQLCLVHDSHQIGLYSSMGDVGKCLSEFLLTITLLCWYRFPLSCTSLSEGGFFKAKLSFPPDYPFMPPTMRFISEMWYVMSRPELHGTTVQYCQRAMDSTVCCSVALDMLSSCDILTRSLPNARLFVFLIFLRAGTQTVRITSAARHYDFSVIHLYISLSILQAVMVFVRLLLPFL